MWNHLKSMKRFFFKAFIAAMISAFLLSFVFSLVYNKRSINDQLAHYTTEENHRLDYNLYVIEQIMGNWTTHLDFLNGIIISDQKVNSSLSDDAAVKSLPKWLERQMLHNGYTEFEYFSLSDIMYSDPVDLPSWLDEIPYDKLFSAAEDKIFVSWFGADSESGKSFNYFRLSRPVWLSGQAHGAPDGIYSFIYPAERLITGNKMIQGAEIAHMMLTDSSTRVIAEFDDRPSRVAIRAVQEIRNAVTTVNEGYIKINRGSYFWRRIKMPEELVGVGLFTSDGYYYLISEIVAGSTAYKIFSGSIFFLMYEALKDTFVPFLFLMLLGAVVAGLLALRKNQQLRAKYLSEYDQMSGTLNRYTGLIRIQKVFEDAENMREMSICFVDINGLKQVNDVLGHDYGDELIKTAAQAIMDSI
ncbi:MAG: GGDEF domain-containing protein [Clostridiaceae bacterium]|nr:GGDEF domain-containing protein [Clostridiaceae bacterium]